MTELANGNYYYFLREPGPFGVGHMGWGLQYAEDRWLVGSLENVGGSAAVDASGDTDYWMTFVDSEAQMLHEMRTMETAARLCDRESMLGYTYYKKIPVTNAKPEDALTAAEGQSGYGVVGNNCLDNAVRIGDAYGVPVWSWMRHVVVIGGVSLIPKRYFYDTLWWYTHQAL
jgi:hypothetical protein